MTQSVQNRVAPDPKLKGPAWPESYPARFRPPAQKNPGKVALLQGKALEQFAHFREFEPPPVDGGLKNVFFV